MRPSSDPLSQAADSGIELGLIGLRLLAGRRLPRRHRRAGVVVVASDINEDAGVAAIWLACRFGRPGGIDELCQYERIAGNWQYVGGGGGNTTDFAPTGRPSAALAGQASMLTHLGGTAGRSRADLDAQGDQRAPSRAGWVAGATFRVATEVTHLQVGARRVEVPEHGHVIVAWKAPPAENPGRPPVTALSADGAILSELGPDMHLDSLSWAAIEKAIGQQ